MGRYTMIADVGEKLVSILQRELVPAVLPNPNEVGLCSPEDHGDISLGLFLYDVKESEEVRQQGAAVIKKEKLMKPPIYLNLYYMITAYSGGDIRYKLTQEQRILGKVMQTFYDYPMIPLEEVDKDAVNGMDLRIQMQKISIDEKSRIWNFPNVGNKLSLFYKVSPVAIESELTSDMTRVTDLDITVTNIALRR
ncbi:MAG: DUF4255 domain-containing protein [Lachnospiraceae bacterium]|nr:DUF4255 domain-containing protein [Lachnospiraceae bacterium]